MGPELATVLRSTSFRTIYDVDRRSQGRACESRLCLVGGRVGSCAQEGQSCKASCEMLVPMRTPPLQECEALDERRGLANSDRKIWLEIQATGPGKEQAGRMES